ncbi:uncharacterized protein M421DRAFT_404773 [Didymella exigua CBS 183.55]|uniref:Uncharacterized protein n=1 Tax=Didymella exigua CBS 183.55 TaxID=1150837 RepID=A0A6A5R6R8_9PLEO|nr:uncharacterized protein M421DRAFT_404773 [Didymella exigua CBS 183.55]KAF1923835.1 hypothetical protein M421DRAFT_404773 [Didymella exigua CBS 183.55]
MARRPSCLQCKNGVQNLERGEAYRNTITAGMSQALTHRPLPPSGPSKTKSVTAPPAKRRKPRAMIAPEVDWNSQLGPATNAYQSPYDDEGKRHFSHVSQGFINDGDRYSSLVLHNAANPFEYEPVPSSTITTGTYGFYWHVQNEIHWTTLATDQRHLFEQCLQADWLVENYKWKHDAKPTEKRFHRTYWLAANQQDMKGLLNRGSSNDKDKLHDLVAERSEEDPDRDFVISEDDLMEEWDVTSAEADTAWQELQNDVEALGENFGACGPGWQHVVFANTELRLF